MFLLLRIVLLQQQPLFLFLKRKLSESESVVREQEEQRVTQCVPSDHDKGKLGKPLPPVSSAQSPSGLDF